ncbi:hypothetical protein [Seohaeicola zhoushanensis]|uniref:Uncharacterized protein n=1 Tax=Seohaeicola zhoushanensis TaxID=1569283 RepID=A0A8J3M6Z4_9RHOB|nr:hypothetical protein [Seohaeicola zhoushanensis]GHF33306.1 hypothetical protein GCM10017056_00900 [Seohaeicola zhoushanensis]
MADPIATAGITAQACRIMEKTPVSSLADGGDLAASLDNQYLPSINFCLAEYDWSFARKLTVLPPLSALPAGVFADPDLPGTFQLPGDCLVLRKVYPNDLAYRQDGTLLRALQTTSLTIRYTAKQTNEAVMPPAFTLLAAYELALRLAPQWVGSRTKREDMATMRGQILVAAQMAERTNASHFRLDGRDDQPDWATEAIL